MTSMLSLNDVAAVGRYRWIVPLMACFETRQGWRFVELLNRLGVARDSLSRTLDAAVASGWIARNRGHGHPLRPEYVVTDTGYRIASACRAIADTQNALGLSPAALTRWSLPLVRLLADGEHRFNRLAGLLPEATPRAVSIGLKSLITKALVDRVVIDAAPPATRYDLTDSGERLAVAVTGIAA